MTNVHVRHHHHVIARASLASPSLRVYLSVSHESATRSLSLSPLRIGPAEESSLSPVDESRAVTTPQTRSYGFIAPPP